MNNNQIKITSKIKEAIQNNKPIVALESTLISHGLPYPDNINVANESIKAVEKSGSIAATIGIINGIIKIGLNKDDLENKISVTEKKLNLLKTIRLSYGDSVTTELAVVSDAPVASLVVPEKPKLTFEELLAIASIEDGKKVSSKCTACHGFNSGGGNRIGPNLWGILGKAKAEASGFKYSDSLMGLGGIWSIEDMNLWLKSPKKYAPGNSMAFVGLRKDKDRANLIAYLNSMSESPVSLTTLK